MKLEPIGRMEHPEDVDREPIEVPLIAYTEKGEEVEQVFRFRGRPPTGASIEVLRGMNEEGNIPVKLVLEFIDASLLPADQEVWEMFVNDPDIYIEQDTLVQLYQLIMEVYAERPTRPQPASPSGQRSSKPTSKAGARKRGSTGKKSR